MSAELACRALDEAGVGPASGVEQFAAGNSSQAWLARGAGRPWVVRTPIAGSGRRPSAHAEVLLSRLLPEDLPVPRWQEIEVDATTCTVAPLLPGRPITADHRWSEGLIADVADVLGACHRLADDPGADRWGPLADRSDRLVGISGDEEAGVVDRWFLAPISGFESELGRDRSVVHSDLHAQHILIDGGGRLAGLLDFGDAFIGSAAWDLALLQAYFGRSVAEGLGARLRDGEALVESARTLSAAVASYKAAKRAPRSHMVKRS